MPQTISSTLIRPRTRPLKLLFLLFFSLPFALALPALGQPKQPHLSPPAQGRLHAPQTFPVDAPITQRRTPTPTTRVLSAAFSAAGASAGWGLAFPAAAVLSLGAVSFGIDPLFAFAPVVLISPVAVGIATLVAGGPVLTPLGRVVVPSATFVAVLTASTGTGLFFLLNQGRIAGSEGVGIVVVTVVPALAGIVAAGVTAPFFSRSIQEDVEVE